MTLEDCHGSSWQRACLSLCNLQNIIEKRLLLESDVSYSIALWDTDDSGLRGFLNGRKRPSDAFSNFIHILNAENFSNHETFEQPPVNIRILEVAS